MSEPASTVYWNKGVPPEDGEYLVVIEHKIAVRDESVVRYATDYYYYRAESDRPGWYMYFESLVPTKDSIRYWSELPDPPYGLTHI